VVEICFFNAQNKGSWPMSPLHWENNIQGEGRSDFKGVQTLKHPDLLRRQGEFVSRIVQEVNSFDNVILEICDEPFSYGGDGTSSVPDRAPRAGSSRPKPPPQKHLLGQQIRGGSVGRFSRYPAVSVRQYIWEKRQTKVAAMGLDSLYDRIPSTPTRRYYPRAWYEETRWGRRVKAGEFLSAESQVSTI
jgi:hypothetical protein